MCSTSLILRLLYSAGPNTKSKHYTQVKANAADTLSEEGGADVNAEGGYYGNTIQAASAESHETVVCCYSRRGRMSILKAMVMIMHSRRHQLEVMRAMRLLLEKGAISMLKTESMAIHSRRHQLKAAKGWRRYYLRRVRMSMIKAESMVMHSRPRAVSVAVTRNGCGY